jgi:cyclopropane-fatty-acyl-phospholipid synthase
VSAASRFAVHRLLAGVEGGDLLVVEGGRTTAFGGGADRHGRAELRATITVHDHRFYGALLRHGSSGLGEAYRLGWFDADDLTAVLRLLLRAMRRWEPLRQRAQRAVGPIADPVRRLHRPDAQRDRENIAAHYDLGNEFFELFLDETLTYSSGWFEHPETTMAEASVAKLERLCRALDLRPGQRVLEIGTGWGSFALHAAREHGVEVVTTTLSAEQHRAAAKRVAEAGLADRVDVRLDHYRDVGGTFDAVVAIEMIEAVDWREVEDFLRSCTERLGPRGVLGLQAIVIAPAKYEAAKGASDFIKTHIFPGGCVHSVPSILAASAATDLVPTALDDFGMHYAETLRRWRSAFLARLDDARALGFDDAFLRVWDLYLAYCEAGFEERQVSVVQLVLERPGARATLAAR